jgi:hypothetical protein
LDTQLNHTTVDLMEAFNGKCYCGNIHLTVTLSRDPSAVNPRACDCDFCQKHGAAYVSDPRGSLDIRIKDEGEVGRFQQGSEIAEMLLCRRCGVLVAALFRDVDRLFGTLNVKALDRRADFGTAVPASPKSLAPDEKTGRWRELWFPDVRVGSVES